MVIEQLKVENFELNIRLSSLSDRLTKATEFQRMAEEEANCVKENMRLAEMENTKLQQEVHRLTYTAERFKNTAARSVDEFLNKLDLDLGYSSPRERCTESRENYPIS
jgi:hypothetical protein